MRAVKFRRRLIKDLVKIEKITKQTIDTIKKEKLIETI